MTRPARPHDRSRALIVALFTMLVAVGVADARALGAEDVSARQSAPDPGCGADAEATARAEDLMADRYVLGSHDPVDIPFPPTWAEEPFDARNWRYDGRVVFSRGLGYLLVEDRLDAAAGDREAFVQLWHLREDSEPRVDGATVRTRRDRGNVVIRQLRPVDSTRIVAGRERPLQGWVSYRYRRVEPSPVVQARIVGPSARFLTLLVPVADADTRVRVSDVDVTPDGVRATVAVGGERERIVMSRSSTRITPLD